MAKSATPASFVLALALSGHALAARLAGFSCNPTLKGASL
jgi:hypothetical protein